MTVFEKIKAMNIDEFAEWFDKHCSHDTDPCINWWNDTYCSNCKPEIAKYTDSDEDDEFACDEFAWCELHGKCKFYQDMNETPDTLQMTKLWLESEV